MNAAKKAFESFNGMNRMGMQLMKNMMGRISQAVPGKNSENAAPCGMPDFQKVQAGIQAMNQKAAEKIPPLGKLMDAQGSAQEMAKSMIPAMREQMTQMMQGMQEMNRIALDTMQSMFDANCKMMAQVFDAAQKAPAPEKAEEPAAPVKAEEPAKAEKPAASEKKAPTRTRKPAAPAAKKAPAKKPAKPAAEAKKEEKAEA